MTSGTNIYNARKPYKATRDPKKRSWKVLLGVPDITKTNEIK